MIETCILVEIDLEVYIFARKVGFTGSKVCFFSYFAVCSMGREVKWGHELWVFLLGNAEVTIFFNGTVVCFKKPFFFFLSFYFFGKVSDIFLFSCYSSEVLWPSTSSRTTW